MAKPKKTVETIDKTLENKTPKVSVQECFKIVDHLGNVIRVYDKDTHGEDAKTLATQFAEKFSYKVI